MDRLDTSPERVSIIIKLGLGVEANTYTVFQSLARVGILGLVNLTPLSRIYQAVHKIFYSYSICIEHLVLSCCLSAHMMTSNDQLANHLRSPPR
jgi:hypothetical protein